MTRSALDELAAQLAQSPRDQPTVVATHLCYDALTNKDELLQVLAPYRILVILGGHYHKTRVDHYQGRYFVQLPSPAPNGPREVAVFRISPERLVMRAFSYATNSWVDEPGKSLDAPLPLHTADTARAMAR